MAFGEGAIGEYAIGESDLTERIAELSKADAGHVIIAVAITDQMLETLILSHMPKMDDAAALMLFSHGGPLGSLRAKAKFAKALDWISDNTHRDLKEIQNIRNAFAHPRGFLHFASPEVAALFSGIKHWPSTDNRKALFDERVELCCKAMKARVDKLIWQHAIDEQSK